MGVTWVVEGGSGVEAGTSVAEYEAGLGRLGAEREAEALVVDALPFYPQTDTPGAASPLIPFHLCHHSDFPGASFVQLMGQTAGQGTLAAVAERSVDGILRSLAAYAPRPQQSVQLRGSKWRLGDFRLGVGAAVVGGSVRGVVLELEYAATLGTDLGLPALRELLPDLFPKLPSPPPPAFPQGHKYEPQDTLAQYLRVFASLNRAPQQPPQPL